MLPEVFREEQVLPAELMIPAVLKYDYMMYYVTSKFGFTHTESGECNEYDYRLHTAFEKLDHLTQKYYTEQNKNEQA